MEHVEQMILERIEHYKQLLEQAIKDIGFYRRSIEWDEDNYVTPVAEPKLAQRVAESQALIIRINELTSLLKELHSEKGANEVWQERR